MISAEELAKVLKEPPEQVQKYIAEYDLDNDGQINYEVRTVLLSGCLVVTIAMLFGARRSL